MTTLTRQSFQIIVTGELYVTSKENANGIVPFNWMNGMELKLPLEHKHNTFKLRGTMHNYLKLNTGCTDDLSDVCLTDTIIEQTQSLLKENGVFESEGCNLDFCIPGIFINTVSQAKFLKNSNSIEFHTHSLCDACFSISLVTLPASDSFKNISGCKTVKQVECFLYDFTEVYKQVIDNEMCQKHCQKYEYDGKLSYKKK